MSSADGYVGLNPIGHGVTNVALVVPQPRRRWRRAAGSTAYFLERLETLRRACAGRVDGRRIVREVLVTGPFAARARRW